MDVFKKFFCDVMSHIIWWNAGEKIKSIFELFIKQKIEFKFVLFLMVQTLLTVNRVSSKFEFQASKLKHNFDQWPLHWSKINLLFFLSPMAYKIINRATKDYKILIPKVIFQYQKSIESFKTRLKRLLILSSRD